MSRNACWLKHYRRPSVFVLSIDSLTVSSDREFLIWFFEDLEECNMGNHRKMKGDKYEMIFGGIWVHCCYIFLPGEQTRSGGRERYACI